MLSNKSFPIQYDVQPVHCYGFINSHDPIYFPANTYMKEMTYVHYCFDLSIGVGNGYTLYGQMS